MGYSTHHPPPPVLRGPSVFVRVSGFIRVFELDENDSQSQLGQCSNDTWLRMSLNRNEILSELTTPTPPSFLELLSRQHKPVQNKIVVQTTQTKTNPVYAQVLILLSRQPNQFAAFIRTYLRNRRTEKSFYYSFSIIPIC